MSDKAEPVSLTRYVLQFLGIYALGILATVGITMLLNFDPPSATGIILLVAASGGVAQSFVGKTGRVMLKPERVKLAAIATAVTTLMSALWVWWAMSLDPSLQSEIAPMLQDKGFFPILVAIAVFVVILSWAVVYFTLGFFCKSALKRLQKTVS
jgi:hypothetical protein